MAQLFTLKLTDGTETVDFLGYIYGLMEGGFNISSLRARKPSVALYRPGGIFIPVESKDEPRSGEITFQVSGADRGEAIENLGKIRRILRRAEARKRFGAGERVELQYAWEGSDQITYFEVYGGAVDPPEDVLSIDKMHVKRDGRYIIPECTCQLWMSTYGYAISPLSGSPTEVPLFNPYVGSKQTGGVNIKNPYTAHAGNPGNHYNYVEIAGTDLPGSEPYITRIKILADPTYWYYPKSVYIGHRVDPQPTKLIYESDERAYGGGSNQSDSGASNGSYVQFGPTATGGPGMDFFGCICWELGNATVGTFYAFLEAYVATNGYMHYAVGVDDYVWYQARWIGNFHQCNAQNTTKSLPLGSITLPMGGKEVAALGNVNPDLWLGVFKAWEATSITYYVDFLYLLPIDDGLRIWVNRGVTASNIDDYTYDDGWTGQLYRQDAAGPNYYISTPWYGLLEPIKLEPGVDQNLYFYIYNQTSANYEHTMKVQVYVVPTYTALAT